MFKSLFVTLLAAMTTGVATAAPWPLEIIDHLDDATLVIYANESDIESSPRWSPAKGAPPFGLTALFKAVGDWKKQNHYAEADGIEKVELKPIARHEKEGRWYYLVQLKDLEDDGHAHRYLAVLMNGKTIAAVKEPEAYK